MAHSWQSHDTREEFGANRRHGTLVHMVLGSSIREGGVEKEWRKGWLLWGAVPSLSRSAEFRQETFVDCWVCVVVGGSLQEEAEPME